MAAIKSFQELTVWQKSHELVLLVYKTCQQYPKFEEFGLASQTRRCAVSIPSNIAEGFKRKHRNDSLHFYNISEGSLEELKYQILLARDLQYIDQEQYNRITSLADEVGRLLFGWIKIQK